MKEVTRLVNLTPHVVRILSRYGQQVELPPASSPARCRQENLPVVRTFGSLRYKGLEIDHTVAEFGEIAGLPDPVEGTVYVVSAIVAEAAKKLGRQDVVMPGPAVRNQAGQVIACKGLQDA